MSKLIWASLLSILAMTCLGSCKKDAPEFLKRNTDHLVFSYNESSATFTVRATGPWSITIPGESSWIKVSPASGVGDGNTYQTVQVTCEDNPGEAREGTILLQGGGQSDVALRINQDNGVFEWLKYDNGAQISLQDLLVKGGPSSASITIPYIKATGKENVKVDLSFSGKGAEGLTAGSATYTLEPGNGTLQIPIMGTPTQQGSLDISVKVDGTSFGTLTTLTGIGQVLIDQSFTKFLWGGDCIGNKPGVSTTAPTASMTLGDETAAVSVGTNGANGSGVTSTIKSSNPAFYKSIGMEGWSGLRNYMRPGYIQLGAASATANEFGCLITPALSLPAGSYDLLVKFKLGIYTQPAPGTLAVGLVPNNTAGITIDNFNSITSKTEVPVAFPELKWVDFSCIVKNATNSSSLVFTLPESLVQGGAVQAGRIYIDDIKVSY